MSLALILGVASMLAVVGLMSALGLLEWTPAADFSGADLLRLAALRLVSGFAVAFIEETFLRGAMHTAIERESGTRLAVLLTALLYAATHFLASHHIAPAQVTPRSGPELLAGTLHSWAQPAGIVDAFLARSEEHTSELQSRLHLVCRLLLEKKKIRHERTCRCQTRRVSHSLTHI